MTSRGRSALVEAARDRRTQVIAGAVVAGAAAIAGKNGLDRLMNPNGGPSRSYRLKSHEGAKQGIRRIAVGRADHALEQLDATRNGNVAAGIHEARKDLKKLRSALRLVRDGLGKPAYRRENTRYRDAARRLAPARDAEVKLQTVASLEERFGRELPTGTIAQLRNQLELDRPNGPEEFRDQLEQAAAEVAYGCERIPDWRFRSGGWDLLEPGLRRSYRRGRKLMARTRTDPTDANVHEWRKRVKDLWYQLRIVGRGNEAELGEAAERAHDLSDRLGDHHDLAVLAEDIQRREETLAAPQRTALCGAIRRRQAELLGDAFEIATEVYADKPKKFSAGVRRIA